MTLTRETDFINQAMANPGQWWDPQSLAGLSGLKAPESLLGNRSVMLRADISTIWCKWFIESLCDPDNYVSNIKGFAYIYHDVLPRIRFLFPRKSEDDIKEFAKTVSRLIQKEVYRRREIRRTSITREIREYLVDMCFGEVRCWICGRKFTDEQIMRFIEGHQHAQKLPYYVDIFKPIGLVARDMKIEVDHVVPVKHGGGVGDNLRLSCGWCNSHKSGFNFLYEVGETYNICIIDKKKTIKLPNYFWTIRTLATRPRCEFLGGCDRTTSNDELTVYCLHEKGVVNPANIAVTCMEHDPIRKIRHMSRKKFLDSIQINSRH